MTAQSPCFAGDGRAVSDVVGSVLLVGITVISAAGFGLLLFAFDGPPDTLHINLELRTDAGADGTWGTGDERFQVVHLGGEALARTGTTLSFTADGTTSTFAGTGLGSAFSDGELVIGEVWESPASTLLVLDQDEGVETTLVESTGGSSALLAAGTVTGGGIIVSTGGGSCAPDTGDPTVAFVQSPTNLATSLGTTGLAVSIVASDACSAVDIATAPHLWYRISPGPLPGPSAFTDTGAMAFTSGTTWTKTLSAPTGGWLYAWGQTLQYYVTGVTDTATTPNVLSQSATRSDVVDLVGASAFVQSARLVAGAFEAVGPFANMQADDGTDARLLEACATGPPVAGVQTLCGTGTGGTSVTAPESALTSNDQRASMSGAGAAVYATGFDVPAEPTAISQFAINYEGQRGTGGAVDPVVQLEYQYGAPACTGAWTSAGSAFTITSTSDTTTTRTVTTGAPFSAAQVESLCVRARITLGTRTLLTDALQVEVTYDPVSTPAHDLNVEVSWSGLDPLAVNGLVDIQYTAAAGESYTVEKYTGLTWTACSGTMASTSIANFQCPLSLAELLGGSPTLRILGASDAAATTTLRIDYVRVAVTT